MDAAQGSASLPLAGDELWLARLRRSLPTTVRRLPAGHVLAGPGQPLGAAHVVVEGCLAVEATSVAGRRAMLALLGPGAVVGLEGLGRNGSDGPGIQIRTLTPCTTLAVQLFDLAEALERDPALGSWMVVSLSDRLDRLERALGRALSLPVRARVLDLLRELASAHGRPVLGGMEIPIPLSQEDLGALVGATRESVNRALRRLVTSGLVRRGNGRYVLAALPSGDQP